MNRRPRWALALASTALALSALSACSSAPAAAPTASRPAASAACPTADEVAGLTAVPFERLPATGARCRYRATTGSGTATIAIDRRPGATTLAGYRYRSIRSGSSTTDAPTLAFDGFTQRSGSTCTAWTYSGDGVVTTVAARADGSSAEERCDLARTVGVLTGRAGSSTTHGPAVVSLIAPTRLFGSADATERLAARVGSLSDVRVDLITTRTGRLAGSGGAFAAAKAVQPSSAAVVLVTTAADAGEARITVLKATTAALSRAAVLAPRAERVVVGPPDDGTVAEPDLVALRDTLASAAAIAGATYVDPTVAGASGPSSQSGSGDSVAAAEADALAGRIAANVP